MSMLDKKMRRLDNASPRVPKESLHISCGRNAPSIDVVTFSGTTYLSPGPEAVTDRSFIRKTRATSSPLRTHPIPEQIEPEPSHPIEIYTAYVDSEKTLFEKRIKPLYGILSKQQMNVSCHADDVTENFAWQQHNHLETAGLIILLVSPDFLNTHFCYDKQMVHAVARHYDKQCFVIPILARATSQRLLRGTPFGALEFLPGKGHPIPYAEEQQDNAFEYITDYILDRIDRLQFYT